MVRFPNFKGLAVTAAVAGVLMAFGAMPMPSALAGTLRVATHAELKSLDPVWTTAYIVRNHGYLVYDTLFALDGNSEPQPQMVKSWTTSKDGKTWTFTLRDGLKWHDGTDVTAEDCIASLQRWGKRDGVGQRLLANTESLTATDAKTFTLTLKKPLGFVLSALAKSAVNVPFMMPKKIAETDPFEQITDPIGSGPYIYNKEESVPGTKIVYDKNNNYVPRSEPPSGAAGGKVAIADRIEWDYFPNQDEAAKALLSGDVAYMESPSVDLLPKLQGGGRVIVASTDPLGNMAMVRFNAQQPPFDNVKVRHAVLMALKQEDYMKAAFGENATGPEGLQYWRTCDSVYPCGTAFSNEEGGAGLQTGDLDAAKKALADSGYNGTPVVIMNPVDNPLISALTRITADKLKAIGMTVDVQDMSWGELIERRASREPAEKGGWNMFHTWWQAADLMDPLSIAFSGNPETGWFGWPTDEKLESERDTFARALTEEKKSAVAARIQNRVRDLAAFGILGQFFEPVAYRDNVMGITTTPIQFYWNMSN